MNPIEIRGSENGVSHRSKIMERKKYERKGKNEIVYASEARQSNFCTTTFSRFREGVLREEAGEFTCAFTCVRRPWERMNSHEWSSDSRFVHLFLFLPFDFSFLPPFLPLLQIIIPWSGRLYRRFPWNLTKTRRALSISPSLMIINAWRDEISLMEHNIPAVDATMILLHFPNERHFSQSARSTALRPRDFYHNAQVPFPLPLLTKRINFTRRHIA